MRVASTRRLPGEAVDIVVGAGLELEVAPEGADAYSWLADVGRRGVEILLAGFQRVDRGVIDSLRGLRLVIAMSSGYDHIDVAYAEERGICVANQPEAIAEAVSDHVVAMVMALYRRLLAAHEAVSTGSWGRAGVRGLRGRLLRGSVVGIVGMGRIGVLAASKLSALGASRILYWSRRRKPEVEQLLRAEPASLERLFSESDIIVVALPRARETVGLIGYSLLSRVREGAVLVNVGRGGVVSEEALSRLLDERRDVMVGLDVFEEEPLPPDSPLLRHAGSGRLLLTPHIAGYTAESMRMTAILAARQAVHYASTGEVWNPVNSACRQARDLKGLWEWV